MLSLILSLLIAVFAFGMGAGKLFKKGTPMYWQLYVCAAGCFAGHHLPARAAAFGQVGSMIADIRYGEF